MGVFSYEALDAGGRKVTGIVDAENVETARARLRSTGLFPTDVQYGVKEGPIERLSGRISPRDVAAFVRQLATLIGAGFTVVEALTTLSEQSSSLRLRRVVMQVLDKVREGRPLSEAIRDRPDVFPGMFSPMIRAGEKSGKLPEILMQLSGYVERRVRLTDKIIASVAYPTVMLCVAVGVVTFLLVYVVPTLIATFEREQIELPLATRLLIFITALLRDDWWLLIGLILACVWLVRRWLRTAAGRERFDRWCLTLPLIGPLYTRIVISRFVRTLGVLLRSEVQILSALEILRGVVQNVVVAQAIDDAKTAISHGTPIARPLRASGIFPPMVVDMVQAGQKSGELSNLLLKLAEDYELEVEAALTLFTSILEPIIILFMGLVVAFIVMAIVLPLMELNKHY